MDPADAGERAAPLVLLVADDLLFPSRIREAIKPLGYGLRVAATEAAARAALVAADSANGAAPPPVPPCAVLVNLNARRLDPVALIRAFKAPGGPAANVPLLAFAGHVETEKHDAARAAGADLVAANSSVSLHLDKLLGRLLGHGDAAANDAEE